MKATPRVSIVLPTYNRAAMLGKALDAILLQTYRDIEIIVINDGSKDNTREVLEMYAQRDERIHAVNQTNAGLPASLNAGFHHSKGEYLTWTSDDNYYHPNAIELMAAALDNHSEVGLVYCDYELIDEKDNKVGKVELPEHTSLLQKNYVGACFLYRRQVYDTVGEYDTDLFLAEDYDYWMRVAHHFPLLHLDIAPYSYRHHGDSLTAKRSFAIFRASLRARLKNSQTTHDKLRVLLQALTHWRKQYLPVRAILQRIKGTASE